MERLKYHNKVILLGKMETIKKSANKPLEKEQKRFILIGDTGKEIELGKKLIGKELLDFICNKVEKEDSLPDISMFSEEKRRTIQKCVGKILGTKLLQDRKIDKAIDKFSEYNLVEDLIELLDKVISGEVNVRFKDCLKAAEEIKKKSEEDYLKKAVEKIKIIGLKMMQKERYEDAKAAFEFVGDSELVNFVSQFVDEMSNEKLEQ